MKFINADTGAPVTFEQLHSRFQQTNIYAYATSSVWSFFELALTESGLTWPEFEEATFRLFWCESNSWLEVTDYKRLRLITNWLKYYVVGVTDGTTVHIDLT